MKRILFIFIILFLVLFQLFPAPKLTIRVNGKWTITLKVADLVSSAGGSDFAGVLESAVNEISVTISKTTDPIASPWRLDISRVDTTWDPSLVLYARRTGDGTGDGTINGGTVYQEITNTDQIFFDGTGDRSSIDIQLKLSGVSANNLMVTTYAATVYYTVTEL